MKNSLLLKTLPIGLVVAGLAVFLYWQKAGSGRRLVERDGTEAAEGIAGVSTNASKWEGQRIAGPGTAPTDLNGTWPWFRGPDLNAISTEKVPLARTWPESGPPLLWKIEVGEGFAAPAILKGRVFLTDYDHKGQADALRCLSLVDGQELWRYTYPVKIKRYHGMSRTIPAVTDKFVVSFGPKCHVICCDSTTGELRWKMDLVKEYHATVPEWYAGQCPLLDGDRLILATGGDALVIAVDLATGKVVWKTPNPRQALMTHSSLTPVEFKGKRMYVYPANNGVYGVAADDGRILWDTDLWTVKMANIPAPLYVGDGRLLLSGGYNAGSMMVQLEEAGDKFTVKSLFRLKPGVFGSTQQTPILYQNHIFGVLPEPNQQLACLALDGKSVWTSGVGNKFGKGGPYMIAQGMIYVLNDDGLLTLVEASTTGFKKLAQAQVLEGSDAWGPMALADGRLLVRDMTQLLCLDVRAK